MSEFDKEAERERLREKFEAEREDREATQRMSELLLQGATMTNMHCEECGDPIFRYEGEEFCPTCQTTHADAANGETAPEGADEAAVEAEAETEPETDGEQATPEGPADTEAPPAGDVDRTPPAEREASAAEAAPDESATAPRPESRSPVPRTQPAPPPNATDDGTSTAEGGDLAASRDAVSRTLTDLAHRAEGTEDLGRKRTLLAAVREAAEAISAIDEATR